MERCRKRTPLLVAEQDRETLGRWARRGESVLAVRAQIVLECATGATNVAVAERFGVTEQMVGKWRARYLARGVEGLLDEPRSGAPRTVSDEQVEAVIAATLAPAPAGAARWSTRAVARRTGLSQSTVSRIWRASGLYPHRAES